MVHITLSHEVSKSLTVPKGMDLHNPRTSSESVSLDMRMVGNYPTEYYVLVKNETILQIQFLLLAKRFFCKRMLFRNLRPDRITMALRTD